MRDTIPPLASAHLAARLRLIRIAIVAFILLLGAGFTGYLVVDRSDTLNEAREDLTVLSDVLADSVAAQLSIVERQLIGMQRLVAVSLDRPNSAADSAGLIRDVMLEWCRSDPGCMDLLVINASGEIDHWTGAGAPPSVADREYVSVHLNRGVEGLFIGIPTLSRVHIGRWFFAISLAERDVSGRVRRVFVSIRDLSRSFDYASVIRQSRSASFAVVANTGEIYVREPNREQHMGKIIPAVARVIADAPGESRASTLPSRIDGFERVIVTKRLERFALFAAATQVVDDVLAPWQRRAGLIAVLWLLLVVIAVYVGRRLSDDARLQNYLASIDALTGTLNRRALMNEARKEGERRSAGGSLGLMMIDIDHFKRINDNCGHMVGDEVLRRVAAVLRLSSRGTDILGRYGGEEFLLLLPGADERRLAKVGEKLRAAVEAIPALEFGDRPDYPETLTISAGGAILKPGAGTLDSAIGRADRALYKAKNAGRNRVVIDDAAD